MIAHRRGSLSKKRDPRHFCAPIYIRYIYYVNSNLMQPLAIIPLLMPGSEEGNFGSSVEHHSNNKSEK